LRHGQREVVSQAAILLLGHSRRGNTEAEEANVVAGKILFDAGEIEKILMHDLAQFGVLLPGGAAHDGQHKFDVAIEQALAQHSLPDHAGCAEENHFHRDALLRASKFLIVARGYRVLQCKDKKLGRHFQL
jgi:hypothetical protein